MPLKDRDSLASGIFITFSGNCKEALDFYRACFGGMLHLETFDEALYRDTKRPVIIGSLVSERIIIHGSDLVHDSGRRIGNHLSIFLPCEDEEDRQELIRKLESPQKVKFSTNYREQKLVEVTDPFDVSWVLSI
jgi:uncharacterized glyoxalase superfamily protein PhnB